jgi:hypothetical protein
MDQGGVYGGRDGRSPRKHLAPTCVVHASGTEQGPFFAVEESGILPWRAAVGPPSRDRFGGGALAGAFDFCRTAKPASPDMERAFQ